ncbi:hypothetical protein ACS0TY_022117 [Phlomoides rotata]
MVFLFKETNEFFQGFVDERAQEGEEEHHDWFEMMMVDAMGSPVMEVCRMEEKVSILMKSVNVDGAILIFIII